MVTQCTCIQTGRFSFVPSAQPRTTKVSPGEQVFRASAQQRFPPGFGKPLRDCKSLSCSILGRLLLNYPKRVGIPNYFFRTRHTSLPDSLIS